MQRTAMLLALGLALATAACGSGDGETAASPSPVASASDAPSPTPSPGEPSDDDSEGLAIGASDAPEDPVTDDDAAPPDDTSSAPPDEGPDPGSSAPPGDTSSAPPSDGGARSNPGDARTGVDDRWIGIARNDLAGHLAVSADDIVVADGGHVDWNDSSLGCPEPGNSYLQVITPGYRLLLEHNGRRYHYHGAEDQEPFLCEDPDPNGYRASSDR